MGLDMYAFTLLSAPDREVDFPAEGATNLWYWRKHPDLHGWMEELYRGKGGQDALFNCATLMLTRDDLDALEAAIRHATLPHTIGFFFGESDGSEYDDDLEFIARAHEAIDDGLTVGYSAWW